MKTEIEEILENIEVIENSMPSLLELDEETLTKCDQDKLEDLLGLTNEIRELAIQALDSVSTIEEEGEV